MLPSSLTRVLPCAWVCSTHPPVSVCGTDGVLHHYEAFLGPHAGHFLPCGTLGLLRSAGGFSLPASQPYALRTSLQLEADLDGGVPPSLHTPVLECSPVVHRLRFSASAKARLTRRGRTLRRKPQTYGEHGSHMFHATHASILTSGRSTPGYPWRFAAPGTLPYCSLPSPRRRQGTSAPCHYPRRRV